MSETQEPVIYKPSKNVAKAEELLLKARFQLVRDHAWFGCVAMSLDFVEAQWVPTCAVDGRHFFFNADFVVKHSPPEIKGIVCHETMHVAMLHFARMKNRDPFLWNIAGDYKINDELQRQRVTLPQSALMSGGKYDAMTVEEVYKDLFNNATKIKIDFKKQRPGSGDDPGQCGGVMEPRDKNGKALSAGEARQVLAEARQTVAQATTMAKSMGQMPASLERLIKDSTEDPVAWEDILRRFMTQTIRHDFTWTRPSRRIIGQGIYTPSVKKQGVGELVVGIDTSGSIDADLLSLFVSNLEAMVNVCEPDRVHVLMCDAMVHSVTTIEKGDPIIVKPVGGGGTSFVPVFDWVAANALHPACLIYFTDMYGSFPSQTPSYPVLWAASTKDTKGPFGETICIRKE